MRLAPPKQVLKIVGWAEMSAANSALFRRTVCAAWKNHSVVEIDLSHTTFIDCAALGALIAIRNLTLGRDGVVRLMNPSAPVQQMLDLMRAEQVFEIVNTQPADECWPATINKLDGHHERVEK